MKPFLDGTASVLAALATLAICGGPAWFTYLAIQATVAPWWAWFFIAALAGVGLLMTVAFLRKAAKGIAPSRERRRT
ncbi:MAG: hypothetical protein ACSHWY_05525 [Octadecabacter sp.]